MIGVFRVCCCCVWVGWLSRLCCLMDVGRLLVCFCLGSGWFFWCCCGILRVFCCLWLCWLSWVMLFSCWGSVSWLVCVGRWMIVCCSVFMWLFVLVVLMFMKRLLICCLRLLSVWMWIRVRWLIFCWFRNCLLICLVCCKFMWIVFCSSCVVISLLNCRVVGWWFFSLCCCGLWCNMVCWFCWDWMVMIDGNGVFVVFVLLWNGFKMDLIWKCFCFFLGYLFVIFLIMGVVWLILVDRDFKCCVVICYCFLGVGIYVEFYEDVGEVVCCWFDE